MEQKTSQISTGEGAEPLGKHGTFGSLGMSMVGDDETNFL
jgi:hypothetical protein